MGRERSRIKLTGPRGVLVDRSEDIPFIRATPPRGLERVLGNGTFLVQDCARPDGWRVLMICRNDASMCAQHESMMDCRCPEALLHAEPDAPTVGRFS